MDYITGKVRDVGQVVLLPCGLRWRRMEQGMRHLSMLNKYVEGKKSLNLTKEMALNVYAQRSCWGHHFSLQVNKQKATR